MEGIPKYKVGAADLPTRRLVVKFVYVAIVPANACQHSKFQLSTSITFGDMRGPKIKSGSSWFHQTPLVDKFLYRALVHVNAYKRATFQLPSTISYGDIEGVPE